MRLADSNKTKTFLQVFVFFSLALFEIASSSAATLVGWSALGQNTYTAGPYSQHQPPAGWAPPSAQKVGGFSAGEKASNENYVFLTDTGFGPKASSMSSLLGMYELNIDFSDFKGKNKHSEVLKLIHFNDVDNKLSFKKQADFEFYGDKKSNNPVDSIIKKNKLLTGGDIDPESFRVDYKGNLWVGEEFGPFLIKLDKTGKVLRQEIAIPQITSPDNPLLKSGEVPTTYTTTGLEGMAINPQGNKLYPMLEKTVIGDPPKTLRIYVFDIDSERFEEGYFLYQLDGEATEIRELVAINDHEFLTIEQNEHWGSIEGQVKKVYLLSIEEVGKNEYVKKTELVDLMHIFDPVDLDKDGKTDFSFPKLTIETIIVLDKDTLLIANDNNFEERSDFIKVRLDQPLRLSQFNSPAINTTQWGSRDRNYYAWRGFHTKSLEWVNVIMILFLFIMATQSAISRMLLKQSGVLQWSIISLMMLVLLLYNHLSLYYFITQSFRDLFMDFGLYQNRAPLQRAIVLTVVVMTALLTFVGLFFYKNKHTKYTVMALSMLLGLKGLQFISYHHVDRVMDYTLWIGRVFDWFELILVFMLLLAIARERNVNKATLSVNKRHQRS